VSFSLMSEEVGWCFCDVAGCFERWGRKRGYTRLIPSH
jgi:hypothetical protein